MTFYGSLLSDPYYLQHRLIDPVFDEDDGWLADVAHEVEIKGSVRVAPVFREIDYHNGRAALQHGVAMEKARREEQRREEPVIDASVYLPRQLKPQPPLTPKQRLQPKRRPEPRPPPPPRLKSPPPPKPLIDRFIVVGDGAPAMFAAYAVVRGFIAQAQATAPESLWRRSWDLWSCQCWTGAVKLGAREHVCAACHTPLVKIAHYDCGRSWEE